MIKTTFALLLGLLLLSACESVPKGPLPILGQHEYMDGDTIFHAIPDFEFWNQDSVLISNDDLSQHIYIADFFFTSCPSICPKVTKQMLRLHDEFKDQDLVRLVSYTMDPKRDNVETLGLYAHNLDVKAPKWHFLTGDKDSLLDLSDEYFIVAYEDEDAPGGFEHSGKIILVDKDRHVRAFAEGTDPEDVTGLITDVRRLINEYQ